MYGSSYLSCSVLGCMCWPCTSLLNRAESRPAFVAWQQKCFCSLVNQKLQSLAFINTLPSEECANGEQKAEVESTAVCLEFACTISSPFPYQSIYSWESSYVLEINQPDVPEKRDALLLMVVSSRKIFFWEAQRLLVKDKPSSLLIFPAKADFHLTFYSEVCPLHRGESFQGVMFRKLMWLHFISHPALSFQ